MSSCSLAQTGGPPVDSVPRTILAWVCFSRDETSAISRCRAPPLRIRQTRGCEDGQMSERAVPTWFPVVIGAFVVLLLFVAYAADPPMAYLLAGLMIACFAVTRIVDCAFDSDETPES